MVELNTITESNLKPEKYIIENILDGKCDIVLNDNIKKNKKTEYDEENNAVEKTVYSCDNYRIVNTNYRETLDEELSNDIGFKVWLNFAKKQYEKQAENVPLEERLSTAEAVIAEILGGEV